MKGGRGGLGRTPPLTEAQKQAARKALAAEQEAEKAE
jgi:hypothetical protein